MDKQLYILGAGRHPLTKQLRARRGHQRRTFYIGELHIQSAKRLPVSIEWARAHFDAIVKHINDGTVLVHFAFDRFVDPDELRVLCFGTAEEQAAYNDEASAPEGQSAAADDQTNTPEDRDAAAPQGAEAAQVNAESPETSSPEDSQGPTAEELANVAERGSESLVDLVDEPEAPVAEPEMPLAEETEPEVVPEAPVAAEEPVDAPAPAEPEATETPVQEPEAAAEEPRADATPEMVPPAPEPEAVAEEPEPVPAEEPAAPKLALPEDWRKKSKTTLLGYAEALGLDTSSMPSNKQLISMIESATKGA